MKRTRLSRRALLKGAGSVAIALPFLEEMLAQKASANPGNAPSRLITCFFGLGLHPDWQNDFQGPLGPYQSLANKMTFASVSLNQGQHGGAHCNTSSVVFVGEKHPNANRAGGASIDQIVRTQRDPTGPTLASGLWWRRGACDAQALRVWNPDGTARLPIKRPSEVFRTVFGTATTPPPNEDPPSPAEIRAAHLRRSVLDTVLSEYQRLRGNSSPLGSASKQKLELHLSTIRELERELADADAILEGGTAPDPAPEGCNGDAPSDPNIGNPAVDYDRFTYGTGNGAPTISWQDVQRVFRLHADLFVQALRCEAVRFGNLMFESAGGHTNLSGNYSAMGQRTNFPGTSQHDSYFHGNDLPTARLYQHLAQTNIAYFLEQLDDPAYPEANEKTVLDNTCVVIGTEYGWNHSKENVFHAIAGADGCFNPGFFTERDINGIDLYNSILKAFGINANIGQATGVASTAAADFILA